MAADDSLLSLTDGGDFGIGAFDALLRVASPAGDSFAVDFHHLELLEHVGVERVVRIEASAEGFADDLERCPAEAAACSPGAFGFPGAGLSTHRMTKNPIINMTRSAKVKIHSGHSSHSPAFLQ